MNITKPCFFLMLPFVFTSCSIRPWKTVKFISSSPKLLETIGKEDFNKAEKRSSDCFIENVFFYFVTNGIEDTMYTTKAPYSINFVFESFDKNTVVTINSIEIELDGGQAYIGNNIFPLPVVIDFPGYINQSLYSGNYETGYDYNLTKVQKISVIVNATINYKGIEVTKDLKATAFKEVKRGIFQYRY